jgi:hypothetical protein
LSKQPDVASSLNLFCSSPYHLIYVRIPSFISYSLIIFLIRNSTTVVPIFAHFHIGLPDTIFFPLDYSTDIKKKSTFAIFRYAAGQGGQQNMLTQ